MVVIEGYNFYMQNKNLPTFSTIDSQKIESQLEAILTQNRQEIADLLRVKDPHWENVITPMETIQDRLHQFWSPISHLNSVMNNESLRQAYNACLPKLSEYATELGQNRALYDAYLFIKNHQYSSLNSAQKKVIDDGLRDFTLSGIALEGDAKKRYQEIQQELSTLTTKFEENLLDATNAWQHQVTDAAELAGLPEHTIAAAQQKALEKNLSGWVLTIDGPCYLAVMTHANSSALRELFYRAFCTRASECNPDYDNTEVMRQILVLRVELATLLNFKNYAEYSLATKMAKHTQQVLDFLQHLADKAKPRASKELIALQQFARDNFSIEQLQVWDIAYYSEKLQQAQYNISEEMLRPYFPETNVLRGLFDIIHKLYGMTVTEVSNVDVWHSDVHCYQITDSKNNIRGYFYTDLYARSKKRGGAWMDDCTVRRILPDGTVQTPVAFLTCNFTAPMAGKPALFTHDEVVTLFHECGHTLHHLLTQVDYSDVSGINGVPWDAVELPSQFFENWCWHPDSIALISEHYETKQPLPAEMLKQMLAAKNFHSALYLVRQLEFALFDFQLHAEFDTKNITHVQDILNRVRQRVAAIIPPDFNRFQHSFSHIFAGGYAAGYYSYLWAEVLASDAFGLFLERGIFDSKTGQAFLENILQQGGSQDPMTLFVKFRGREPEIDALLAQRGLV